jgi:tetratricopeptide (TPR) repeat protein
MMFLLELLKSLMFRTRSLRALAARQAVVTGFACFAAGFLVFVMVRSHATEDVFPYVQGPAAWIVSFLDSHLLQMTLFLSLVYLPALILLTNACAGDGLGFSLSKQEYRRHVSALFPLWGMIFLAGAPLIPHFLRLGLVEISLGELWLMAATLAYTVWALRELDYLPVAASLGVFMLSLLTLPILFLLTNFLIVLPLFIVAPLLLIFVERLRELLATKALLHGFQRHLRAIAVNPQDAGSHFELGLLHFRNGHPDAARGYFEQALRIDATEASYHYYMGRIHEAAGDWRKATDEYEAAYRSNQDFSQGDVFREVGKGYLHTDRLDKALEFLDYFQQRRGTDPEGRYWLAVAMQRAGRLEDMRRQLDIVLDQARSSPSFFRKTHREWIYRSRMLLRGSQA